MSAPTATTNADVIAAIREHHVRLAGQLHALTAAVVAAAAPAAGPGPWRPALEELSEWYRTELIPHAIVEEAKLYSAGADQTPTRLLVRGMLDEHRHLVALIADLALSRDATHSALTATAAEAVFTVHVAKENDLLLPALDTLGTDLGAALKGMHELLGAQAAPGRAAPGRAAPGRAAPGRAAPGEASGCGCGGDHGHDTGSLAAPIQIGHRPPEPTAVAPAAADPGDPGDLDVRTLPHGQRHEIIFARLDALAPGEELVIVNDHDPKPLRYQTAALWPDTFEWTYRESGPQRWRVAISRAG